MGEIEQDIEDYEETKNYIEMAIDNCPDKYIKQELEDTLKEIEEELELLYQAQQDSWKSDYRQLNRDYERGQL